MDVKKGWWQFMDIICEHCQSKFKIADEKIPRGKSVTAACPKCRNKITIMGAAESTEIASHTNEEFFLPDDNAEIYDASEKPFDFIEEEGKTALICDSNPATRKTLIETLDFMEYHTSMSDNIRDVLTKMRYHNYDLIFVNELFDTTNPDENAILTFLERLPMTIRRYVFVVLISDRYRTMDNMMAFNKSVNMIINTKNIQDVEKILKSGLADHEYFYRVFKDALKDAGRV
jgi:predicted Zn finger-like uncharacterized protein